MLIFFINTINLPIYNMIFIFNKHTFFDIINQVMYYLISHPVSWNF
jgi:hypothetical protein